MKRLLIITVVIVLSIVAGVVLAEGTCPDGNGWVKVESSDFVPVDGAVEYCWKAGSENSQGCNGGIFDTWPLPEGACGLSHWSYKLGEPTATPEEPTNTPEVPTSTPTPSETPTVTVTPTRTPCYPLHCGSG